MKEMDWPTARESGRAWPFTEKAGPETLTLESERGAFLALVRVTVCNAEDSSGIVEKFRKEGDIESLNVAAMPEPEKGTASEGTGALLMIVRLPENVLGAAKENTLV